MPANTSFQHNRLSQIALILILMVAVWARFRYLGEIEHNIDHAYPVWQAMRTLEFGEFPLAGQGTSVLFDNPALTGYLFIPAVALTGSPIGVYVFIIALNSSAVWMAYRAVRTVLGVWPGLFAAALMAANPWVIEYSRTSWVQSLLPFFVTAVAWLLWPVLLGKSAQPGRRVLLAALMATLLSQTYLLAFLIVAPVGLLIVIYRKRVPWRAVAAGIGLFALALALFIAGLAQNPDEIGTRVDDFSESESRITIEAFESAVRLVSGAEYELARGTQAPINDADLRHDLSRMAGVAALGLVLVGIGAGGYAIARKTDQRDSAVILLVWFGLPVLAMSYTGNPVHPFYQLMGLPAGYGLAAWGVLILARNRTGAVIAAGLLVLFAVLMLLNSARYYQETEALPGIHGFGALPVDVGVELGDIINAARADGQPVYLAEQDWIINSFAGQLFPVVQDTRAPALTILPPNGALYVSMDPASIPAYGEHVETLTLADETAIAVYRLPPTEEISGVGTPLNVPTVQNITLESYDLLRDGDALTLQTVWHVTAPSADALGFIFTPFIHLFDASGERIAIIDGAGMRGDSWRPGERHIHRMPITIPAEAQGPFTLRVGQFDGINGENVVFLPPNADPTVVVEIPERLE